LGKVLPSVFNNMRHGYFGIEKDHSSIQWTSLVANRNGAMLASFSRGAPKSCNRATERGWPA
jgi:hypothetical protein